jgi:hypothetical protein
MTDWFRDKENDGKFKKWMGRNLTYFVSLKNNFMGSGTARNQ